MYSDRILQVSALWFMVFILHAASTDAAQMANRIVAIVNDEAITEADVVAQLHVWKQDSESPMPDMGPEEAYRAALTRLIEQRLILREASVLGITVSLDEVTRHMIDLRGRFGSEDQFQNWLSLSQKTIEQLKSDVREHLMVQRAIDSKVRSGIVVSPQEVTRSLKAHPELLETADRVHTLHLLVRTGKKRSREDAQTLMKEIETQLSQGVAFSSLAKRYSEDSYAKDGGQMGWVSRGELLPELDHVLFSLEKGKCSEPLDSSLGVHLLCAQDRSAGSSLSATERYQVASNQLFQEKYRKAFRDWVTELKRQAYIQLLVEEPTDSPG